MNGLPNFQTDAPTEVNRFTALRALAHKWVRIIFRCWKNRKIYDEAKYLHLLAATGSPLNHRIEALEKAA